VGSVFCIFLLGLIFGSFVAAYSYRWPLGISINKGRSFCPKCKEKINWYDNIPLLSYLLLDGKCRNCGKNISLRYPIIEFLTALLFVVVFAFRESIMQSSLTVFGNHGVISQINNVWGVIFLFAVSVLLMIILVIDIENRLIPDGATLLIFSVLSMVLVLFPIENFYGIFLNAFLASIFFLFLNIITKGRGMGLGDVKLVLALSLFFYHWKLLLVWLFLSFVTGAFMGVFLIFLGKAKWGKQVPFGPFLIISFFLTLFWGESVSEFLLPYL